MCGSVCVVWSHSRSTCPPSSAFSRRRRCPGRAPSVSSTPTVFWNSMPHSCDTAPRPACAKVQLVARWPSRSRSGRRRCSAAGPCGRAASSARRPPGRRTRSRSAGCTAACGTAPGAVAMPLWWIRHGVAVGRGRGHRVGRQGAAGAGLVFHHHRLAERLGHRRGQRARHHVGGPAGSERHHQRDRCAWDKPCASRGGGHGQCRTAARELRVIIDVSPGMRVDVIEAAVRRSRSGSDRDRARTPSESSAWHRCVRPGLRRSASRCGSTARPRAAAGGRR